MFNNNNYPFGNNGYATASLVFTKPIAQPAQYDVLSILGRHKVYLEQAIVNAKKIPTFMGYLSPIDKTIIMKDLFNARLYMMDTLTQYLTQAERLLGMNAVVYDGGRYADDIKAVSREIMHLYVKLCTILDNKNTMQEIRKFLDENRSLYDLANMK